MQINYQSIVNMVKLVSSNSKRLTSEDLIALVSIEMKWRFCEM
ncbi:MAG: hypothetical protein ACTS6G_06480 [Candidatus Hodgkinia cicadicola]